MFFWVEQFFCCFFVLEVSIRFLAFSSTWRWSRDFWFLFDLFLVMSMAIQARAIAPETEPSMVFLNLNYTFPYYTILYYCTIVYYTILHHEGVHDFEPGSRFGFCRSSTRCCRVTMPLELRTMLELLWVLVKAVKGL